MRRLRLGVGKDVVISMIVGKLELPDWIHLKDRDESKIEAKREDEAKAIGRQRGHYRTGRHDTYVKKQDIENANILGIVKDLEAYGLRIVGVHAQPMNKGPHEGKPRIRVTYSEEGEPLELTKSQREDLQMFFSDIWRWVNVFLNQPDRVDTINCTP